MDDKEKKILMWKTFFESIEIYLLHNSKEIKNNYKDKKGPEGKDK